jgi:hypothetical protein
MGQVSAASHVADQPGDRLPGRDHHGMVVHRSPTARGRRAAGLPGALRTLSLRQTIAGLDLMQALTPAPDLDGCAITERLLETSRR